MERLFVWPMSIANIFEAPINIKTHSIIYVYRYIIVIIGLMETPLEVRIMQETNS